MPLGQFHAQVTSLRDFQKQSMVNYGMRYLLVIENISLVIISFILMTLLCDAGVILLGDIR